MQIFLSHSTRQKPLVREIKKHLPTHLISWIDEERLLFGDHISACIESTIQCDTDYVLLFLDDNAARSEWVRKELDLTFQAEKRHGRLLLLPILIDDGALQILEIPELHNRKYLHLADFRETSVRSLSESISAELFALVCRDMDRLRHPQASTPQAQLADAETLLRAQASVIQKAVFPHRRPNPVTRDTLLHIVNAYNDAMFDDAAFDTLLTAIVQRNLIPGLSYDGFEAFLIEEHASWKSDLQRKRKEQIGRKTAGLIRNGMKIMIDAGSTSEEVVRLVCKKIENRALTKITIATTSVNIADMISDCCVKMGFDDDFTAVTLFIPGGRIRPNTQAIVAAFNTIPRHIIALADCVGGFDVGIVGVNGVDIDAGFTTHENPEALNKMDILSVSTKRLILGDSSKIGLVLEQQFAAFGDAVNFIVDDDAENENLQKLVAAYRSTVILA